MVEYYLVSVTLIASSRLCIDKCPIGGVLFQHNPVTLDGRFGGVQQWKYNTYMQTLAVICFTTMFPPCYTTLL